MESLPTLSEVYLICIQFMWFRPYPPGTSNKGMILFIKLSFYVFLASILKLVVASLVSWCFELEQRGIGTVKQPKTISSLNSKIKSSQDLCKDSLTRIIPLS